MANRKKATDFLLKYIDKILPGSDNKNIYEELLSKMSDKKFDELMHQLRNGEQILFLISPNLDNKKLDSSRNLKLAKELGHDMFQHLQLTDPITKTTYLTPLKYLVIDLPVRRQAQTLNKKVTIPKDNSRVDMLTGQSAADRVGGLSFPELQVLNAQGLDSSVTELIKFRGGDEEAFRMMNDRLLKQGNVRLDSLPDTGHVKSTQTLANILKAMHIDNNL